MTPPLEPMAVDVISGPVFAFWKAVDRTTDVLGPYAPFQNQYSHIGADFRPHRRGSVICVRLYIWQLGIGRAEFVRDNRIHHPRLRDISFLSEPFFTGFDGWRHSWEMYCRSHFLFRRIVPVVAHFCRQHHRFASFAETSVKPRRIWTFLRSRSRILHAKPSLRYCYV